MLERTEHGHHVLHRHPSSDSFKLRPRCRKLPIDPTLYLADGTNTPATLLGPAIPYSESPLNPTGIGATEDDVSVLWLKTGARVTDAVDLLERDKTEIGLGQIYYGPTLALNYNVGGLEQGQDRRSPNIIVTPNIGVTSRRARR